MACLEVQGLGQGGGMGTGMGGYAGQRDPLPSPKCHTFRMIFPNTNHSSFRITDYSRYGGKTMLYNFHFLIPKDGLV